MIAFTSIPSTNDYAKAHIAALPAWELVFTTCQTAGRGQFGRVWLCDGQLAATLVIKDIDPARLPCLPIVCGEAIACVLRQLGRAVDIKPPNDLMRHGHKVGGVLCESMFTPDGVHAVCGFGLNVTAVPSSLPTAGSLDLDIAPERLATLCAEEIKKRFQGVRDEE